MKTTLRTAPFFLSALLVAACATDASSTDGADNGGASKAAAVLPPLVPVESTQVARAPGLTPSQAAVEHATLQVRGMGLANAQFAVVKEIPDAAIGLTHVRLNQTVNGVKVYGADLVVHMNDSVITGIGGNVLGEIGDLDTTPALTGDTALQIAVTDQLKGADIEVLRPTQELVVWLDSEKVAHLAWHTTFNTENAPSLKPGRWNHIVDAASGAILGTWNSIHTATVVQASGPGGNAKWQHPWTNALDVVASGTSYTANTDRLKTVDMKNKTTGSGTVVTGPLSPFSDAPIDDAHGYAEITLNMLRDWQGYNSIDNAGMVILSRVHYDVKYENAYWDGTQMTYGDGDTLFYPLSGSLDVVAHEIDHGFTEKHSGLDYTGEPGGLNESFSDIAGVTAEFYDNPTHASFNLGEDVFKAQGEALRYMCNPTQDGTSIDNAANMTSSLDPHYSSGVMNKAFCQAAKRFSANGDANGTATQDGVKRASFAWYKANATYWTSSTSFVQACQGIYDAATANGFTATELGYITASWSAVGVTCGGATPPPPPPPTGNCDVTYTTDTGTVTSPNYPNNYANNTTKTYCIKPTSGKKVKLTFNSVATEANYDFIYVYNDGGTQVSKTSGTTKPAAATGANLSVKFTSDYSVVKKGFTASWK